MGARLRLLAEHRDYHSCVLNVVILAQMYLCLKIKLTEGLSITLLSFEAFGHPIMLNSFCQNAELLSECQKGISGFRAGIYSIPNAEKRAGDRKHFRQGCDLKEMNRLLSLTQALLPGLQKSASFYWYSWKIKQLGLPL